MNVRTVELDHTLDEFGFRHAEASVGELLGGERVGASVYEAQAGAPIWPYHYHHGVEEWLYVIAGAPVLREPGGERALTPGDLVCFASGPTGAHTLSGPGRFAIFASGYQSGPFESVYPDSGKVSGPEGIHLLDSAVGYWHGEGTAGPMAPDDVERDRRPPPRRLEAVTVELAGGDAGEPFHYVHGRETWLLVLDGAPTLRDPAGEHTLEAGDLVCCPDGPAGAHGLRNDGEAHARVLTLTTTGVPANVCYPDTGRWQMLNS